MIKAVIFDCFGVVIRDVSYRRTLDELGHKNPDLRDQIIAIVDESCDGIITMDESRDKIAKLMNITPEEWEQQIVGGEIKDPQMIELIHNLRKDYKTAILSNIGGGGLQSRFTQIELHDLFDVVVASAEVGMAKPDREIFEYTADKLGVKLEECVFIDDYDAYAEAARHLGMKGIHYQDFNQAKRELTAILTDSKN